MHAGAEVVGFRRLEMPPVAAGHVREALEVLPKLRRELLAPSLARLAAADPLATCTALESAPGLSCITPLMVAHTMGGLARPDVPLDTRTALLHYLQNRVIFSGTRHRVLHDLYVVLLVLHPEEHELHRCVCMHMHVSRAQPLLRPQHVSLVPGGCYARRGMHDSGIPCPDSRT